MSNPTTALHDLLEDVALQGPAQLKDAWSVVLKADYGTTDFAVRYCEVVALLRDTLRLLAALPSGSARRYERYTDAWWKAVISPTMMWNNSEYRGDEIISRSDLDQLAGLGDLVASRLAATAIEPAEAGDLTDLRVACVEWLLTLREMTELRQESRAVLAAQIEHLVWLIDNANFFGVSRVVQEAQAVGTAVGFATQEVTDPEQQRIWRQNLGGFLKTVAAFTVAGQLIFLPALTMGNDVLDEVNRGIDAVADVVDGPDDRSLPPTTVNPG